MLEIYDSPQRSAEKAQAFNESLSFLQENGILGIVTERASRIPGSTIRVRDSIPDDLEPGATTYPFVEIIGPESEGNLVKDVYGKDCMETTLNTLAILAMGKADRQSLKVVHWHERRQRPIDGRRGMVMGSRIFDLPFTSNLSDQIDELEKHLERATLIQVEAKESEI